MANSNWHGSSPQPFNIQRYAPDRSFFTEEEHGQARRRGYEDAVDRWCEIMDYRKFKDWRDSVLTRAKQATRDGLASVGLSGKMLGALGRAAHALPAHGAGRSYDPDQVSFGNSRVDDVRSVLSEMESMGVSPNADESEVPIHHRERFGELKSQLDSTIDRIYDLDLNGALRQAASSPPRRVGDESMVGDYVPEDAELRRIQEAYKADISDYEAKRKEWREQREFNVNGSPCVYDLPKWARRILSVKDEDAWSSDDDESKTEDVEESADNWGVSDEGNF